MSNKTRGWWMCEEEMNPDWFCEYEPECKGCIDYEACKIAHEAKERNKHEVQTKMECPDCHNTKTLHICKDITKVWCPECDFDFTVTPEVAEKALAEMKAYQVIISAEDGTHVYHETDDIEEARDKMMDWLGSVYNEVGPDSYVSAYGSKIFIERRK